ncbi:MAG: polysaccharide deacetylase family protein, partial [Bdellovibrionota bacterium]
MDVVFCFDCEGTEPQIRAVAEMAESHDVPLTIFAVGETARSYPALFRELSRFHEVHTHSDRHLRHRGMAKKKQRELIRAGRACIEDLLGRPVTGFRAPFHSIDRATVEILNEEKFLFDASGLYHRYDMGNVRELRPSWFREWAPWYPWIGLNPDRAFSIFRWLAKRRELLVLPVHPHYTGAAEENLAAFGKLLGGLKELGGRHYGGEALVRAQLERRDPG